MSDTWHNGLDPVTYPKSVSSIPGEGSGELSEGKLTRDNWYPSNMAHGTRTVYPDKQNKGLSSTFQPPEEGQSVQWPKCCDKQGDKDEDNSPKNVNNVDNTSSQEYRQILYGCIFVGIY